MPSLLKLHGIGERWSRPKFAHKLLLLLHLISEGAARDRRNRAAHGYVALGSRYLGKLIGPAHVGGALATLQQIGAVQINPCYRADYFSKSFRLAPQFRGVPSEWVEIKNATLSRKVRETTREATERAINGNPVRAAILANLAALSLTPEGEALAQAKNEAGSPDCGAFFHALHDITSGAFWMARDENTGRLFHNVTSCPRELRKELLLDGEQVAEVDISNAQFFFLQRYYDQIFDADAEAEAARFRSDVSRGEFYEQLFLSLRGCKQWGTSLADWAKPGSTHRDRFKKQALQHCLYTPWHSNKARSRVRAAFCERYPALASHLAFCLLDEGAVSQLGNGMQGLESELMLSRVFPRLLTEFPNSRAISLHDGILCKAADAEQVRGVVLSEAQAVFGMRPTVRVKMGNVPRVDLSACA